MSFQRYLEYRDSGVEWMGELPVHWMVTTLGRISRDKCDGPFGSGLKSEHYVDEGVRVIRLQNIRHSGFNAGDGVFIDERYYREELNGHDVVQNDVLVAGLGDDNNTVGRACVAPARIEPAMVKADCFRFRLNENLALPQFVAFQLCAGAAFAAGFLATGSTRSRIPLSAMASRRLALPPVNEQRAVAEFLERETAKIDALVAEQRRLMELLKEKRQAVISHAVTKGLNSDAPMKASGVEWIGEVPRHWDIQPYKRFLAFITSGSRGWAEHYTDSGEVFLRISNLTRESIHLDLDDLQRVQVPPGAEGIRTQVQAGDVLFSITAYLGSVAVIPPTFEGGYISQHIALTRLLGPTLDPKWAAYTALSNSGQTWFALQSYGGTKIQLSLDDVREMPVVVPPLSEQLAIIASIESVISRFEEFISQAQGVVELLQARRLSLISAAVTGQIDVRGLSTSEAA